jgi:hypothetical protein
MFDEPGIKRDQVPSPWRELLIETHAENEKSAEGRAVNEQRATEQRAANEKSAAGRSFTFELDKPDQANVAAEP